MKQRLWATAFAILLFLISNPAMACPSCAGREEFNWAAWTILAAFVSSPFIVVAITWPIIKRVISNSQVSEISSREDIG